MSTKLSHTPGPWRVEKPEDELVKFAHHMLGARPTIEIWADGEHAAGGFYHAVALVADDEIANANLIAAAPEMLEALRKIADRVTDIASVVEPDDGDDLERVASLARAAIAKAVA